MTMTFIMTAVPYFQLPVLTVVEMLSTSDPFQKSSRLLLA